MKTKSTFPLALFAGTRKERRQGCLLGRRKRARNGGHTGFTPIECHEKPLTRASIRLYSPGLPRLMNLTRRDLNRLRQGLTNGYGQPLKRLCQIKRELYRRDELASFANNLGTHPL